MQTAVSDSGRLTAAQKELDPEAPRVGLTVAANPRLGNLSLEGVVGAWPDGAEPEQPAPGLGALPAGVVGRLASLLLPRGRVTVWTPRPPQSVLASSPGPASHLRMGGARAPGTGTHPGVAPGRGWLPAFCGPRLVPGDPGT